MDPLAPDYPGLSPYAFATNTPIGGIDLDGLELMWAADGRLIYKAKKNQGYTQIIEDIKNNVVLPKRPGEASQYITNSDYINWTHLAFEHSNYAAYTLPAFEEKGGDMQNVWSETYKSMNMNEGDIVEVESFLAYGDIYTPPVPQSPRAIDDGPSIAEQIWNHPIVRNVTGDYLSGGISIEGGAGPGGGSIGLEYSWILRGKDENGVNQGSLLPILSLTTSVGPGAKVNGNVSVSFSKGIYTGAAEDVSRSFVNTNSFNGDIPTTGVEGDVGLGANVGASASYTHLKNTGGNGIISNGVSLGLGAGLGGTLNASNTYELIDNKKVFEAIKEKL